MAIAEALISELEYESKATRRLLERVPEDCLAWKPHEKSMSLGLLAMHVATAPGEIARMVETDVCERFGSGLKPAVSRAELLTAFEASIAEAKRILAGFDDEAFGRTWKLFVNGQEVVSAPRRAFVRSAMFNHLYHHRGQLTVYLRMQNVPLPSIYGPSADERL